ncbi:MAG: aminotransferase class III-fold pyridoxal phosphate-dependent enzyme [Dehalococcoidia bacterium]|nr:aminotransferase class III-fold pyridoxal phosphate-dependent enzyme [Dehalococcoidia bacterium]
MPGHDESARLRQAAKHYVWPTFGKDISFFDEPASVIVSGQGSYVTDASGKRYVDGWSEACAATLGHNHP